VDFTKYISTPKNTAETDAKITNIKLTRGRLVGGFLFFPSGPAGTLHFLARIGPQQLIPFNAGESYNLDDCVIPFHLEIDLSTPPYEINVVTWNTSTLYDHSLTVGFYLTPTSRRGKEINALSALEILCKGYHKP